MMTVQNSYSLLCRTYEVGLSEISIREKSGLLAYSPLAGGFLTGKYRNNNLPEKSRQNYLLSIIPDIVNLMHLL